MNFPQKIGFILFKRSLPPLSHHTERDGNESQSNSKLLTSVIFYFLSTFMSILPMVLPMSEALNQNIELKYPILSFCRGAYEINMIGKI